MAPRSRWAVKPFLLSFFLINFTGMCYFLFDYQNIKMSRREMAEMNSSFISENSHSAILPQEDTPVTTGRKPVTSFIYNSSRDYRENTSHPRGRKLYDFVYEYVDVVANPTDSYQYSEAATLTGIIRNRRRRKGPRLRSYQTTPFSLDSVKLGTTQVPALEQLQPHLKEITPNKQNESAQQVDNIQKTSAKKQPTQLNTKSIIPDIESRNNTPQEKNAADLGMNINGILHQRVVKEAQYLVKGDTICSNSTFLVVLIRSSPAERERRQTIRQTWAKASLTGKWGRQKLPLDVKIAFLLGDTNSIEQSESVQSEVEEFKDIVQGDFDGDGQHSERAFMGLRWVLKYCAKTRFILSVHDESFVNVPTVEQLLLENSKARYTIFKPSSLVDSMKLKRDHNAHSDVVILDSELLPLILDSWIAANASVEFSDLVSEDAVQKIGANVINVDDWEVVKPTNCDIITGKVYVGTGMGDPWYMRHIWSAIKRGVQCKGMK